MILTEESMERWWDYNNTEVPEKKTCPKAFMSATKPTQTGLRFELGLCGQRPASNRLSHGKE